LHNATWTANIGNPAAMTAVSVTSLATLNTTNFTGSITNARISDTTLVNFTGGNGQWDSNEWTAGGSFAANAYTGGGNSFFNSFVNCVINISNRATLAQFRQNDFSSQTNISATGAVVGTLVMTSNVMQAVILT
jgi:hypothetical protein